MAPDILLHASLPFPTSLPVFQRMFPDDAACADYLEKIRWERGFACPHCGKRREPFRFANRPHVLRCRKCKSDIALTAGTVMQGTHMPLSVWFWGAYLVASHTAGMSATQFQRQLGLSRYETAFQILHKLRAGMVRPDRDQIGAADPFNAFRSLLGIGGEIAGPTYAELYAGEFSPSLRTWMSASLWRFLRFYVDSQALAGSYRCSNQIRPPGTILR